MIKLATLLMLHTNMAAVQPPAPLFIATMTNNVHSQFSRLMASTKVTGPWTQVNQPDGTYGQRSGTNYLIPKSPNAPVMFFTIQPSP